MSLSDSVTLIQGVTPIFAQKLARINIHQVRDLIFHWPLRYEDRARLIELSELKENDRGLFEGQIVSRQMHFGRKMKRYTIEALSKKGLLRVQFFRLYPSQWEQLVEGKIIRAYGEVRKDRQGFYLSHPTYTLSDSEIAFPPVSSELYPIYKTIEGVTQKHWKAWIANALLALKDLLSAEDGLSQNLRNSYKLPAFYDALCLIHQPVNDVSVGDLESRTHKAWRRLIFEELCAQYHVLSQARTDFQKKADAPIFPIQSESSKAFLSTLPFELTSDQKTAYKDIASDLSKQLPMMRLLQGDVGSGKTVVAALAALQVMNAGYQVAFMAPTEILAEQHTRVLKAWFEPLGHTVVCLNGGLKVGAKRDALLQIKQGTAHCIVGTHALFQATVEFKQLGLIIIDEQHRFGVQQRYKLGEKSKGCVHQLLLSATPIPRTLAMVFYADLDVSIIREKPKHRKEIQTAVISDQKRDDVTERIKVMVEQGEQVYWVCPLIEESEKLPSTAAQTAYEKLLTALPSISIGLVHGRMPVKDREKILKDFRNNKISVLVATTVIEVGVDIPNASLMVIENAERFGLSQLHQLRGRVGRGTHQSYCVLLYQSPLSLHAKARLQAMRDSDDGFLLAEADMKMRGPGEWLGTRQTGEAVFKAADILRDHAYMNDVLALTQSLKEKNPETLDAWCDRWASHAVAYATV